MLSCRSRWRKCHRPHPFLHTAEKLLVRRWFGLLQGIAWAFAAALMPTLGADILGYEEYFLTVMALPSDPNANLFALAECHWKGLLGVARIPARPFIEFFAELHILPSPARPDSEQLLFCVLARSSRLVLRFVVLLLNLFDTFGRIARTFLASLMLAVAADLIGAIASLATMTCAPDPHADFLLNSFSVARHRPSPLVRTEGHAIFGKQYSSFLLLSCAALSCCLCGPCAGRSKIADGLLNGSRNGRSRSREGGLFASNSWFCGFFGSAIHFWSVLACSVNAFPYAPGWLLGNRLCRRRRGSLRRLFLQTRD